MGGFVPEGDDLDLSRMGVSPGIIQARMLARRLERIVEEMGEGISETLYRRAHAAVVRGNHDFILADADSDRIMRGLMAHGNMPAQAGPVHPDIGLPGDPWQLRDLWENISASDRDEIFRLDPFVGNRDGIPQVDRDIYNRRNLDDLLRQAENSGIQSRVHTFTGIKEMLNSKGGPPIYLSYIDERGKLAFWSDNPDLSDNAAVLLLPTGRDNTVLNYGKSAVDQVREAALRTAPKSRTAVGFWGAYDQPKSYIQSIFAQPAQEGGARVRDYHDGLRATHEGTPANTTTVGHSYAGVLAGESAGHGAALNTDNVVLMGSWGTGADHVGDLGLTGVAPERTGEQVFSTMARSDHIQLMPETFGRQPVDSDFGARVFESRSLIPGSWNEIDHSAQAYLDSANPASGSIGLIITGHGDLVS